MIEIGFTRSDYKFSQLIRDITREPVSHCIIIVDDLWVIHSNFSGVHAEYIGSFLEHSEILYRVEIPGKTELDVIHFLDKYRDAHYDYGGMLFLGLSLYLRRQLPWLIPKRNLWQCTGMFLCTELITQFLDQKENSLITPLQLYAKLLQNKEK